MRKILTLISFICCFVKLFGNGGPSTYFNLFVPPNNDAVKRNVCLVVTATLDSTKFSIIDDGMDGDEDDSISGYLMAGQSYIMYIKDKGINDDALYASGGVLKRDGDYFIVQSDKLVYASMSTDSDWQHDFVPSVNKKMVGGKFFVYAPKTTNSNRDLNVFAFENNTTITISKISFLSTLNSGYTNIDFSQKQIVVKKTLNIGQDIIYLFQEGRNIMNSGDTYMIESNKPVSVQYGALYQNERDGGGNVPASNGSTAGELFYFAVPYQVVGEQEIRIVSWDDANSVKLERYSNGSWIEMKNWQLNKLKTADWVGKNNGNVAYSTVFRITCTSGKKVSVTEANWMETGSPGTSDMATMMSSANGTSSGKEFITFIAPPGNETNVFNPFTNTFFGGRFSHLYLFASHKAANVTVKDIYTNGVDFNKTFHLDSGRYADCSISLAEWYAIYNGTGKSTDGAERPYLMVTSDENIAVLNTNFNDNWMNYFGSSLPQAFLQTVGVSDTDVIPGDTIRFNTVLLNQSSNLTKPTVEIKVGSGAIPIESTLIYNGQNYTGNITKTQQSTTILYDSLLTISAFDSIQIETKILVLPYYNNGDIVSDNSVISIESVVTGVVDGYPQQSIYTQGIKNNSTNTVNMIFNNCPFTGITDQLTNSWNSAWVDINNDDKDDLMILEKSESKNSSIYLNNNNGNLGSSVTTVSTNKTLAESATWADINNDGYLDVFIVNSAKSKSTLYLGGANNNFTEVQNSGIDNQPQYFHGASFADIDNDGWIDLVITNFFATRFHQLYKNNGNSTFSKITNTAITQESNRSTAPIWCDYNNDGFTDLFIPNGDQQANSLFKNIGGFQFEKVKNTVLENDKFNSVGAAWGDYDNDGDLDLLVTNSSNQNNNLYRNDGNDVFTKIINLVSSDGGHSHGVSWVDIDNDSDLDIYISNDKGNNFMYINQGNGNFTKKIDEFSVGHFGNSISHAWSDINNDGYLDFVVTTHTNDKNWMFCNQSSGKNYIKLKLQGIQSNRSAIGAKIRVKAGNKWQVRHLYPYSGFGSTHSFVQHFGLDNASSIDSIEIKWPSGNIQYINSVQTNQTLYVSEENSNFLFAKIFQDLNNNCIKDENESYKSGFTFKINPINTKIGTNKDGEISVNLPIGNYTLELDNHTDHWQLACPVAFEFSTNSGSKMLDIPLKTINDNYDLGISLGSTLSRRGFGKDNIIALENGGSTDAYQVIITLQLPPQITLNKASLSYSKNQNTYTWLIDTLKAGRCETLSFRDSVLLSSYVGQELSINATIQANGTESNLTNNTVSETFKIVGAVDPNAISVFPIGEGHDGFISKNQLLTYTIDFQNIGSYEAKNVTITNQINQNADLSTFAVIASSHKYEYSISNDGLLMVFFKNIQLKDSTTNEKESHGFFKYVVYPKHNLFGGEKLNNDAEIIFDYEKGLRTNAVFNTLKNNPESKIFDLVLYPNPSNENVTISIDLESYKFENPPIINKIIITSNDGREVYTGEKFNSVLLNLSVANFRKGVYLIKIVDNSSKTHIGKLIVQ